MRPFLRCNRNSFEAALLMITKQRTPIIQRLGNMANEGSIVHIGDQCLKRRNCLLEPIDKAEFDRTVLGHHRELVTWGPRGILA